MKILQSTVEKMAWYLVMLLFIGELIIGGLLVRVNKRVEQEQQLIIQNQINQTDAMRTYINCIVHIHPTSDIQAELDSCFNAAPKVGK